MFKLIRIWVKKLQHFAFSRSLKHHCFIFSSDIDFVRLVLILALPLPANIFRIKTHIRNLRFLPLVEMTTINVMPRPLEPSTTAQTDDVGRISTITSKTLKTLKTLNNLNFKTRCFDARFCAIFTIRSNKNAKKWINKTCHFHTN